MTRHRLPLACAAVLAGLVVPPAAHAQDEAPSSTVAPANPPAPPVARPRPFIVHLNFGVVAINSMGATDRAPAQTLTLADRQTIVQLLGVGYFVHPSLRLMLSFQLAELVGGAPAGASTLTLAGAIPWVGWHPWGPMFLGAGVLLAPRSYGQSQLDVGVWSCIGAGFPIGHGLLAGAAVQVPVMFKVRTSVSVAPAAFLAYRF